MLTLSDFAGGSHAQKSSGFENVWLACLEVAQCAAAFNNRVEIHPRPQGYPVFDNLPADQMDWRLLGRGCVWAEDSSEPICI